MNKLEEEPLNPWMIAEQAVLKLGYNAKSENLITAFNIIFESAKASFDIGQHSAKFWRDRHSELVNEVRVAAGFKADDVNHGLNESFNVIQEMKETSEKLAKVKSIASAAGHGPCRNGGMDEEGTCPNSCECEWASEIRKILE